MTGEAALGFALQAPAWLLALPMLWWSLRRRRRRSPAVGFAGAPLLGGGLRAELGLPPLPRTRWERVSAVLPVLEGAALAAICLALARPVERVPLPPEHAGVDVLLCLDRSSSMRATDLGGGVRSRLELARSAAREFVRRRTADRAGIVTFARYPDLRCPPTLDHEALGELLAEVVPVEAEGPEDATGIGTAVLFAVEALRRSPSAARVVVLLTDGEENVATSVTPGEIAPIHAAQRARQLGVRIHCIALGRAGGELSLRQMAAATGGRFFSAGDAAALRSVYADIDSLERTPFVEPRVRVEEWYPECVWLALTLGLLVALGYTSRREALP